MMRRARFVSILVSVALAFALAIIAIPQGSYGVMAHDSDIRVDIENGFDPPAVTIQAGSAVEWRNKEHRVHSVASTVGAFVSGAILHSREFTYTFTTPGVYAYKDEYSGFTGTVTVLGQGNSVQPAPTTPTPAQVVAPSMTSLTIGDDFFTPTSVSAAAGTTLTWTNNGRSAHSVTSNTGLFDSGMIRPGQSFSYTFTSAGTFAYNCIFHGGQNGSVTVTGNAAPATTIPTTPTTPPATTQSPTTQSPTLLAGGKVITVGDNNYSPLALSAAAGATVTWTNTGKIPHTVTSDSGLFDSGMVKPGQSFSFTFAAAGTFDYYCLFHDGQNGSVTITGNAAPATTTATNSQTQPTSQSISVTTSTSAIAPVAGGQIIRIGDNNYTPLSFPAVAGTTVTWTNTGKIPHTVTSDSGLFDSGMVKSGQSFSFTFASAGTFGYYCLYHPGQAGTVTVGGDGIAPRDTAIATPLPVTQAPSPNSGQTKSPPTLIPRKSSVGETVGSNESSSPPAPPFPQDNSVKLIFITLGLGSLLGAGAVITFGKLFRRSLR